jgi:LDH2 family malate/lactate/ureidoglycolate dehydrogenase
MTKSQKKTNPTKLKKFVSEIFLFYGFSKTHALLCAEVLVEADLRGIDSHGIARLEGYVRLIENNRINPNKRRNTCFIGAYVLSDQSIL